MNLHDRLFGPPPVIDFPEKYADYRLEWNEGVKIGWETGPGMQTPSLRDLGWKKAGQFSQYYARAGAFNAGKKAGREAKAKIVKEVWPDVQRRGAHHYQHVNNWRREGLALDGVFFFSYGTMELPAIAPYRE